MMYSPDDLLFLAPEGFLEAQTSGQFAKGIILLELDEPQHPGNRDFLIKILAAAQVDPEKDTCWITVLPDQALSLTPLIKYKRPETILVFGFSPPQIGLQVHIPFYLPTPFYGTQWLFSEALSVLEPDKTRKGQLWKALQQCFLK